MTQVVVMTLVAVGALAMLPAYGALYRMWEVAAQDFARMLERWGRDGR